VKSSMKAPARRVVQQCRICGCTEADCSICVERTGEPCTWVDEDLCSACVPIAELEAIAGITALDACGRVETLTPRELEVLKRMAACLPNVRIARELGITIKTLDCHRAAVKRKLGEASSLGVPRHWYLYQMYRPIWLRQLLAEERAELGVRA
jgi:DNA-binding CsgD family transcriptional regulator